MLENSVLNALSNRTRECDEPDNFQSECFPACSKFMSWNAAPSQIYEFEQFAKFENPRDDWITKQQVLQVFVTYFDPSKGFISVASLFVLKILSSVM